MLKKLNRTITAPILVLFVLFLLIVLKAVDLYSNRSGNVFLTVVALQFFVLVLPGLLYSKLFSEDLFSRMRLKPFSPVNLGFLSAAFVLLLTGSVVLNLFMYNVAGAQSMSGNGLFSVSSDDQSFWSLAIAFALVPALTEEFLFRGVLLSEYAHNGAGVASVAVSALFAVSHFDLGALPVYFFGGLIFSLAVYVTDSLFSAVLLHFLFNLFGLFAGDYVWSLILKTTSLVFFCFIVITLFFISLMTTLLTAEKLIYKKGVNGKESPPEEKRTYYGIRAWVDALLSPSFLACVVVFLVSVLILS